MPVPSGPLREVVTQVTAPVRLFVVILTLFVGVIAPLSSAAEPFSVVIMPNPRIYTERPQYDLYAEQARWIRDNKTSLAIKHVLAPGELTNDNAPSQWSTADAAFDILDAADVPYAVVPGNNDYKTGNSNPWIGTPGRKLLNFNGTMGSSRFTGKSWYGGNMNGANENNYTYFSAGGLNFLVVSLEYAPRKEALTWANNLIGQHPNHRVIIMTHAYAGVDGVYAAEAASKYGIVGSNGVDLFEECVARHSNVFLVVSGHESESKLNTRVGNGGNTVYEMIVNYDGEKVKGTGVRLGNGWLRVLEFDPANNTIDASTLTVAAGNTSIFNNGVPQLYHANYSSSETHADHLFAMSYDMSSPVEPYICLNDAVEFHDMAVNRTGTGDQLDPAIGQTDDGNSWVAVWKDDSDNNGVSRIVARGFDSDGNERFGEIVVNTAGVNSVNAIAAAVAMVDDGRFVVAWQYSTTAIKMRSFNADGTPAGAEQTAVSTSGSVKTPAVAVDDDGDFVVTWADDADGNGSFEIKARGYEFDATQRFAAKTVNTAPAGQQQAPAIAMRGNGDYVVTWQDDQNADGVWDVFARGFLANETQRFAQVGVPANATGQQRDPDIAMNQFGHFYIVWENDTDLTGSNEIMACGFNALGAKSLSDFTVNQLPSGNQINPAISMSTPENWYVVWQDNSVSGGQGYQVMSNGFTVAGARIHASDVQANSDKAVDNTAGAPVRKNPAVSAHKSGRTIVAWADDMDGDGVFEILARGVPGTARSVTVKAIDGSVSRDPNEPFYIPDTTVSLLATPSPGYEFVQWEGDVPGGSETANPLGIVTSSDKHLIARFLPTPPAGPSGLAATSATATTCYLHWTDNSSNETNFVVSRATTQGGPYSDVATLPANSFWHTDTGLSPGTTYYYVVRATKAGGPSGNSNEASATTLAPPPAAPSDLAATSATATTCYLHWTDNSNNETNFVVSRSTVQAGPYGVIATLGPNVIAHSDTGLTANTAYYYVVRARNATGLSSNSNVATVLTLP